MFRGILRLLTLLFVLLTSSTILYAADKPTELLFINDELVQLCEPIKVVEDVYYVPLRALGEYLDFQVDFDESLQTITLSKNESYYTFTISVDPTLFVTEGVSYIDAESFFSLLGLDLDYDYSLFVSHYIGQESLDLPYLAEPIVIDAYDDIAVTSLLVNDTPAGECYTNGVFTTSILTSFYEKGQVFLTFNPYTLINIPEGYSTPDMPYMMNYSTQYFSLPVADHLYAVLLDPPSFATLELQNAVVTSIEPLYMP